MSATPAQLALLQAQFGAVPQPQPNPSLADSMAEARAHTASRTRSDTVPRMGVAQMTGRSQQAGRGAAIRQMAQQAIGGEGTGTFENPSGEKDQPDVNQESGFNPGAQFYQSHQKTAPNEQNWLLHALTQPTTQPSSPQPQRDPRNGNVINHTGGVPLPLSAEDRLDSYEQQIAQSDPGKAAELALKRQELQIKQTAAEAKNQQDQLKSNEKDYPINGPGSASDDAAQQQKLNETVAAKTTAKPTNPLKALIQQKIQQATGQSPVSMNSMHNQAQPITANSIFSVGSLHRSPSGQIHRVIGIDADGNPLFSQALA